MMTVEERNAWIVDNIRFIHAACQQWRYREDYEDIIQTAVIGTSYALDRVDESLGDKAVRGYVTAYIEGYVRNYWLKKTSTVYIPRYYVDHGVTVDCLSIEYEYDDGDTFESLYLSSEERGYEEVEVMEDFRRCIKNLPEKVRKTALMIAEGYERKDVAEADGCSKQNINLRVDSIKRACRRLYA
jgi:RNA polymerase sigma factor (sigma-70 family)